MRRFWWNGGCVLMIGVCGSLALASDPEAPTSEHTETDSALVEVADNSEPQNRAAKKVDEHQRNRKAHENKRGFDREALRKRFLDARRGGDPEQFRRFVKQMRERFAGRGGPPWTREGSRGRVGGPPWRNRNFGTRQRSDDAKTGRTHSARRDRDHSRLTEPQRRTADAKRGDSAGSRRGHDGRRGGRSFNAANHAKHQGWLAHRGRHDSLRGQGRMSHRNRAQAGGWKAQTAHRRHRGNRSHDTDSLRAGPKGQHSHIAIRDRSSRETSSRKHDGRRGPHLARHRDHQRPQARGDRSDRRPPFGRVTGRSQRPESASSTRLTSRMKSRSPQSHRATQSEINDLKKELQELRGITERILLALKQLEN